MSDDVHAADEVYAQIIAEAEHYIGDRNKAVRWMRARNRALGGDRPVDLLTTEVGIASVRRALLTVAYGGVS